MSDRKEFEQLELLALVESLRKVDSDIYEARLAIMSLLEEMTEDKDDSEEN